MLQHILESANLFRPETALIVTFCAVLLVDLLVGRKSQAPAYVTLLGLAVTGWFVLAQVGTAPVTLFSNMIALDPFAVFFKALSLVTTLLIVVFSLQSNELREAKRFMGEYYALLVSLTLGMFLMASSTNLIMIYISVELASMSSYLLSSFTKEARDSSEASLKYVIFGAVSSGLMLYGMSILYGLTGSLDLYGINRVLVAGTANSAALLISGILIMAGFGYKISAVPFHFWTPDVYEGAPLPVTAILSVASKAAGFALLMRFFKITFIDGTSASAWTSVHGFEWNHVLAILSVLSMTVGNLTAIWQTTLKRLLAYSSIAHAGYMLLGVVVLSNEGFAAVLLYLIIYLFMNLGAFYAVMLVANVTGSEHIDDYRGLGTRAPLLGVAFTILLLSLTGIPPTAGFVGKLYLFSALMNAKWFWLAIVAALNSVVSLYYYVKVLRNMFLQEPTGSREPIRFAPAQIVILLLFVVPTLLFGVYFGPLVQAAQASITMFVNP
jgi:NADH-quinone oxidoreductase subunit N